jgi:hypothetical protein
MSSIVPGIDVPIAQMPAGMAFDGSEGIGSSFGSDLLGSLGKGLLGALGSSDSAAYGQTGASRTPYTDQTKGMLNYLITEAIKSFEPAGSTIS